MGVSTTANTAGVDKDVATRALNNELQDKGFDIRSGLLRCGNDAHRHAAL